MCLQLYPPVSGRFHRSVLFENFFQAQLTLSKEPSMHAQSMENQVGTEHSNCCIIQQNVEYYLPRLPS